MEQQPRVTVLVADDSATVRSIVRLELEQAGYRVVEAADGREALAVVAGDEVDVVLLDVEMPVLDGFAAIAQIKSDPRTHDLPVVFLTSRSESEDVVEALRLGAHDYLRKPPEQAELLARVGAAARVTALRAELRAQAEELDRLSRTDHLTSLANRRELDSRLQALVSTTRRHAFPLTVLVVDVDHFKRINDTLGHAAGDEVLVAVARRLASGVRSEDVVGRWGGEEFLVLAGHTDLEGARLLAERLRRQVSGRPVVTARGRVDVTVSIGSATGADHGTTSDALLRTADEHLYAAKAAGRDRWSGGPVRAAV